MTDRETVIAALEYCAVGTKNCRGCPMQDACKGVSNGAMAAAARLLKKQEARVLTLEEVLGDECWFEYINGSCGYADVYMQDNKTAIIYRTNIRPGEVPITDYMKTWRCWSYRPTDEQRKAVKWDD